MHRRSVAGLVAGLRAREFSSEEITRHFLERIRGTGAGLNAFITVCEDVAFSQAREADRWIARGRQDPLTGIPIAHKDIFCTDGVRTTCGSKMLHNFVSPYDATVVERCRAAGLVMLGKTNMDEFAMGSSTENSYFGPVRNPWQQQCVPGGSSGGSAAAVAARLTPVATGTDTGGSIRQPAAFCGLTGLKPTYGRVSRYGMVAFASSLDQAGVLGHSAEDVAYITRAIAGFDPRDSTSVERDVEDYIEALAAPIENLRIGLPKEHFGGGLQAEVEVAIRQAILEFEKLGCSIHEISLPRTAVAIPTYYVVALAECSSNLSRYDGVRFGHRADAPADLEDLYKRSRAEGFGEEVKRRIMIGTYVLSTGYYDAYYMKAQQLRRLISEDFTAAFSEVDLIMGPTTPSVPFPLGAKVDDPVTMYLSDVYTTPVSLAGLPAISLPVGAVNDLPVGLQIIANYFGESRLLRVSHHYQRQTDWHERLPPGFE